VSQEILAKVTGRCTLDVLLPLPNKLKEDIIQNTNAYVHAFEEGFVFEIVGEAKSTD
jgi:hypothetical protein